MTTDPREGRGSAGQTVFMKIARC